MEFELTTAFLIDEGTCGTSLKVQVCHDTGNFKEPSSVFLTDTRTGQSVHVPADLWKRVVDGVARQWEQ